MNQKVSSRPNVAAIAFFSLLALLGLTACQTRRQPEAISAVSPPNVVLIVSDDHAWTDYGFMGHPHIRTPHLDRLAAQSLAFTRGYVPSSLCCPSLASLLTGKYPHQHKIANNDPPLPPQLQGAARQKAPEFLQGREQMNRFMDAQATLPRWLAQAGYLSFQSGKWWQGNFKRGGFTHGMTVGDETKGGRHGDDGLQIGRQTMQPIYDFMAAARQERKPFFLWYAPMMPHAPHAPPERLLARYRTKTNSLHVARYWAMVEWFDETCGQLLAHLKRQGLADNTLVIYLADNGWIQSPDDPRYGPKSKQSPYDGGLRTPILVRWPGRVPPGKSDALVSSLDIAPTILRACGVKPQSELLGLDLRDGPALNNRSAVRGACFTHDAVDLEQPARSLRWRWTVEGDWKLILPNASMPTNGVPELYHIVDDPYEIQNLASTQSNRVAQLSRRLDEWWDGR